MPITFEINYLRNLKQESRSCVYVQHAKEHLALHPFQLDNTSNSIKEILNKNIAKYCRHLNGILLGYDNIKLLEYDGLICDDSCYVHTDIEADFYIFRPEINSTLQGTINKISKDHVACLVHKTFTISLPKPEDVTTWIGNKAVLGQEVQFTIVDAIFEGSLPYIKGSIVSLDNVDDSGFSTNEDQVGTEEYEFETPKEKRVTKKRKFIDEKIENTEEVVPKKKKKKLKNLLKDCEPQIEVKILKKGRKRKENVDDLLNVNLSSITNDLNDVSLNVHEKKTKKRKNNASIDIPSLPIEEKIKKRKKNRELNHLDLEQSTNVDVDNSDETFDTSSNQKTKKSKKRIIFESTTTNVDDSSRMHKKKKKSKESLDDTSKIETSTDKYEDLLKRLSLEIGDNPLIGELNDLLAKRSKKSKTEKKRKKVKETQDVSESIKFDVNTLFSPTTSNFTSKSKKKKNPVKIISDIKIVPDIGVEEKEKIKETQDFSESIKFDVNTLFSPTASNFTSKSKKKKGPVKIISDIKIAPDM